MSRKEFIIGKWTVAVGIDGVGSNFIQLWDSPPSGDKEAVLIIDNLGFTMSSANLAPVVGSALSSASKDWGMNKSAMASDYLTAWSAKEIVKALCDDEGEVFGEFEDEIDEYLTSTPMN